MFAALPAAVVASPPVAIAVAAPAQRPRLRLTPAQMFRLAGAALARGDIPTASAIYSALERNRDSDVRSEARFLHAGLLSRQGRYREAAVLLRRILDEKPRAAAVRMELARLLELLGDPDSALRELRAAQATGLPPAVARMVDRYSEALRASRPLGGSFQVSLAPDSNINHATRSDTLGTVFGDFDIDKASKARSDTGVALRGQVFRRLGLGSSGNKFVIRASGYGDLYPESSFNDVAADLAAGPELQLGRNRLNLEIGATQRWFGQKPFMRSARIAATWSRPLGSRTQLRANGSATLIDNQRNDLEDGKGYSGQLQMERALSATTGIAVKVGLDRQSLDDPGYSTSSWRSGLVGWKDVGRTTLTAEAEVARLSADRRLLLFPQKRSDRYARLTLGATLRQFTFRGFAPVAQLTIERNRSTIEFYDYSRTRAEFGIVRAF